MGIADELVQKVWEKGAVDANNDSRYWRKDACGAWIGRAHYGDRDSQYGWEIDHITPGGTDAVSNLRPLQWQNNVDKGDGRLRCNVVASGVDNFSR